MADYASMSDAELDAAYGAAEQLTLSKATLSAGAQQMQDIAAEIESRLASVWSFAGGIFGENRFPIYAARTQFNQAQAARSSVADSASNVASNIGSGIGKILNPSVPFLLAVGLVLYMWKVKK